MQKFTFENLEIHFCEKFDEKSPYWNLTPHNHDYIEFIFFLEGRAQIRADQTLDLSLYDTMVYPAGKMHHEFIDLSIPQEIICIGVSFKNCQNALRYAFKFSDDGEARFLFERFYREHKKKADGYEEYLVSLLNILFILMHRKVREIKPAKENILDITKEYIHNNFSGELYIEHIATLAHVSTSYLSRIFKKQTGMSPMQYITYLRISTAKQLLKSKRYTVDQIAEMTGFSSPSYFWRIFKNTVGVTPSHYE